ncbi:thioredoxin family protein [Moheibacter lacus]|uniref:Thioredoxin family protein n=1 Tax=Moheibacter lacus TaxID=2745851 RepID=A0A838ZSK9_9FLAO|nr:thioredoxin family protein [Moheibacter lacus]MBA5629960.1 thioredoxin family protein [Moheibacter lacus]
MKNTILVLGFLLGIQFGNAQEKFSVYHPEADAKAEIANAVSKANAEGKHVFLQLGGNWCGWCKLFHELTTTDEELKKYIAENYEVVHVNYSKENQNLDVLKTLDYPQRFGFPVFVILDGKGNRIHTQSSGYLEEGKGHSQKKVMEFLQQWSPSALDPANYEKK